MGLFFFNQSPPPPPPPPNPSLFIIMDAQASPYAIIYLSYLSIMIITTCRYSARSVGPIDGFSYKVLSHLSPAYQYVLYIYTLGLNRWHLARSAGSCVAETRSFGTYLFPGTDEKEHLVGMSFYTKPLMTDVDVCSRRCANHTHHQLTHRK